MNPAIITAICVAPIALFLVHRCLLWMERNGWIYYWRQRGSAGIGNAFMQTHAFFQPEINYTLQEMTRQHVENEDAGDPLN